MEQLTNAMFEEKPSLELYSRADVVDIYANASYITDAEEYLFQKYLKSGARVLDLGVGGGRTTIRLSEQASEYVGIDYSAAMIERCRAKFPKTRFEVLDASDLSLFDDESFDVVVFSFNGLGNLYPDNKRLACMSECARLLRPDGRFIFSLHNSHSLLFRPPFPRSVEGCWRTARSLRSSAQRFFQRAFTSVYWKSGGYLHTKTHDDMLVYLSSPRIVESQLNNAGFKLCETIGDTYPKHLSSTFTRWYYYAASKI